MHHKEDVGWLDIGIREDRRPVIIDHDRLSQITCELPDPESQYPFLCSIFGDKLKNRVLQGVFQCNNIKRHSSDTRIKLRFTPASNESFSSRTTSVGVGLPVFWECSSAGDLLSALWSQLIFLFTEVVCFCLDDIEDTDCVLKFLLDCLKRKPVRPHATVTTPRVILVFESPCGGQLCSTERIHQIIQNSEYQCLSAQFLTIRTVDISDASPLSAASYHRVKAAIKEELDISGGMLGEGHFRPNARQLKELFHGALGHLSTSLDFPFSFTKFVRQERPVSRSLGSHIRSYFEIGAQVNVSAHALAPSIASALLMDHYVPGMLVSSPKDVFRSLYRPRMPEEHWIPAGVLDRIEFEFISLFDFMVQASCSSSSLRRDYLKSQSGRLSRLRTNKICLYCVIGAAQHTLGCGHTLCDRCAQIFGTPNPGRDYQFTVKGCLCCLYQRPLIVDVLPLTQSPSILAIDGGGVRGVIPLEFLTLIEEQLFPCRIQDVVDLALGTSSGGLISLGLFTMSWRVKKCSAVFEDLARKVFNQRRHSIIIRALSYIHKNPLIAEAARWVHWLVRDSCYDARVLDAALKQVFGENRRIFGVSRDDAKGPLRSATDHRIIRPNNVDDEPLVWKGGSQEPELQPPRLFDLQGIGSFQDGGLKHNFAGEIAAQLCDQIWPDAPGSKRILSLGTGRVEASDNATPYFRHIFRDSFIRRGFDAWMSTMDTECDWRRFKNQLKEKISSDFHRLNVPLGKLPSSIDDIGAMEDYRNQVLLQPGSARMARDAASMLLVSRFYFVISGLPRNTATPFWCHGVIRCKGPSAEIISALDRLYPDGLDCVSDSGLIGSFPGQGGICPSCASFRHPISFLARHADHTVDVFLQNQLKKRWRLSGFPTTVDRLASCQGLFSPFGRDDHGFPNSAACPSCDASGGLAIGRRRRRESASSRNEGSKKLRTSSD
ncbi:hypothetical protein N7532_001396 [Penicillium argentinense]|uniref:PNPLA domain-containing protein n=1 Tax=Penicillium argentinense TaxID=1131581 RepID=A0A9W9G2D7_9EURO|nr:uncharacterized protein N7532_001396 [Penicillium argentinense]KAJ5110861.1 hypothetical protein N7532_001396 [Penicillium argentinense]